MRRAVLVLLASAIALAQSPRVARVPMQDGVRLSTNIFLPRGSTSSVDRKVPALLVRTPYGKGKTLLPGYGTFVENGYAVIVQDVRGRYESEGHFRPPLQEDRDGPATIEWIAAQPWSDGTVGMLGGSYLGIAQWRAALSAHPRLRAIFPVVAGSDEYLDRFYSPGGALKLGHRMQWIAENLALPTHAHPPFQEFIRHLPLRTMDRFVTGQTVAFYQEALSHPTYDAYWRNRSTRDRLHETTVPAFIVGGWYDNFVESDLAAFTALSKRSGAHRITIGPWSHNLSSKYADVSFGAHASVNMRKLQLKWFEHWMRGPQPAPEFDQAPVRIFVMGANRWRDEREWPIARAEPTLLYLAGGRRLVRAEQPAGSDTYTYDPRDPTPTRGGAVCCNPQVLPWGPMDQREVEARDDVLVYSTSPLGHDLEVTGEVRVVLHVATTAPDTDFTAKLVDVFPDGYARNLCDGILRLRYRNGLRKAEMAKPGQVYAISVPAGVTSNVFKAGHRIRIEVSSSNFPRFDRNPNTGRPIADETELRQARQTIHYGGKRPSHVVLPVIP